MSIYRDKIHKLSIFENSNIESFILANINLFVKFYKMLSTKPKRFKPSYCLCFVSK